MDVQWVKIRSWHAVSLSHLAVGVESAKTMCGRTASGDTVTDLPTEKSCESCLRIVARLQDA